MVLGLLFEPLISGDNQQHSRRGPYSGKHVGNETLVARHVHKGDVADPHEPKINGQAAFALLVPAVRLHAG